MLIGSFGMILLRPYYLIPGVPTTLTAWLRDDLVPRSLRVPMTTLALLRNDLLWAPRVYPTGTLLWCVTLVGFASVVRTMRSGGRTARATALTVTTGVATISLFVQLAFVPKRVTWFVLVAVIRGLSGGKQTRASSATAVKASPRSLSLPHLCYSATRMTEISSG